MTALADRRAAPPAAAPWRGRPPLMVFAGSFWTGSTESGLAAGFRALGWVVQEVDQRDHLRGGGPAWSRALARLTRRADRARYARAVAAACHDLRPDVLFTVKGSFLGREVFARAAAAGARTAVFYPDYHFDFPDLDLGALLGADLFVTTKDYQLDWLRARRGTAPSAFVAHGYDPAAHRPVLGPVPETGHSADIRYIGHHSPAKQAWIDGLAGALPGARLRVIGAAWAPALGRRRAAGLVEAESRVAAGYALAVQTARINLAVHMGPAANGWEDRVSTRSFEIPACGGFMLHVDSEEVRTYYAVGHEIDVFSCAEELADKCRFYLAHGTLRRRMAARAHERAVPAYSYAARAREIAGHLSKLLG